MQKRGIPDETGKNRHLFDADIYLFREELTEGPWQVNG